jgi:DNA-binding NarL/FixJ family response regulator
VDDTYGLGEIADEILSRQRQLDDAYKRRSETILEALSDGHSLREIAEFLGISHTMVAKAIVGL